jgi:hypothetical protein
MARKLRDRVGSGGTVRGERVNINQFEKERIERRNYARDLAARDTAIVGLWILAAMVALIVSAIWYGTTHG